MLKWKAEGRRGMKLKEIESREEGGEICKYRAEAYEVPNFRLSSSVVFCERFRLFKFGSLLLVTFKIAIILHCSVKNDRSFVKLHYTIQFSTFYIFLIEI